MSLDPFIKFLDFTGFFRLRCLAPVGHPNAGNPSQKTTASVAEIHLSEELE